MACAAAVAASTTPEPIFLAQTRVVADGEGAQYRISRVGLDGTVDDLYVPGPNPLPGRPAKANYCRPIGFRRSNGTLRVAFYSTDHPYPTDHPFGLLSARLWMDGVRLTPYPSWVGQGHAEFAPGGTRLVQAVWVNGDPELRLVTTDLAQRDARIISLPGVVEPSWTRHGITAVQKLSNTDARPVGLTAQGAPLWGPVSDGYHVYDPYRQPDGDLVLWLDARFGQQRIRLHNLTNGETTTVIGPVGFNQQGQARWVPGLPGYFVTVAAQSGQDYFRGYLWNIEDLGTPPEPFTPPTRSTEQLTAV